MAWEGGLGAARETASPNFLHKHQPANGRAAMLWALSLYSV
jgi:hypothetical protein